METQLFDHWLIKNIQTVHIAKSGSNQWIEFFVAMLDYLVNPAIVKKNYLIVNELTTSYLPDLEKRKSCLEYLQTKIGAHLMECYDLNHEF